MKIFFDTSAFAKRYIDENGSEEVIDLCNKASMIYLSQLTIAEFISATNRLLKSKLLNKQQYELIKTTLFQEIAEITFLSISSEIILNSIALLENHRLRSLDAIQLSTALTANIDKFVSGDKRQITAAKAEKLSCVLV